MSAGAVRVNRFRATAVQALGTTVAIVTLIIAMGSAHAQVLYGLLIGTVTDKTGAVVPNVTLTIASQETGDSRTTTANEQGAYALRDMTPGLYTISVLPTKNFGGFKQENVQVDVNHEVRIDIALQVGTVTTQVTITEAPPTLQTETAEVNHEISAEQLDALPITSSQGRNFQALYTIVPGAAAVGEQNSTASNPSRAMSANINGTSYNTNTTRIDGAVNYYGWLPYLVAYVPPADSIQSVNLVTNSFNAEQGVAGGAAISITTKSGTRNFHGSAWEYYQDAAINARGYTATKASLISAANPTGSVPKNVFDEFGFNIGGPVYIPHILTGKSKLFFFQNFERTTRRQLIFGFQNVPDVAMLGGDFSEVASGLSAPANAVLYDPQPGGTGPFLPVGSRPTFQSEYGCNCIPASRQSSPAQKMLALLQPISATVGTPSSGALSAQLGNDYFGTGTFAYNRNTSDSKITYIPSENTQIFGKYSIEPFTVNDPQELLKAGGGTFDGGQPGAALGRIQNVGLGVSHVITSSMVVDADFGYTRQVTGAQSTLDLQVGDFGSTTLGIPGTNGVGPNYVGQPVFSFNSTFSSLGNSNGANPFLFRDNQFTGDVNFSWTKGKHSTKYGFTYYHFLLNHFQPTSGSGINNPRGGFLFAGGLTTGPSNLDSKGNKNNQNAYTALADFLLGLPNNGTGVAVAKATQLTNPNALRWSEYGAYAQDQWTVTPKLTLNYGVRYEYYPVAYRDKQGIFRADVSLPQSANVVVGGVGGNPEGTGVNNGWGMFVPRLGVAYRLTDKFVVRSGGGLTVDPESMRFLRDEFPVDAAPTYSGTGTDTIAVDPANNNAPMTLTYGIPATMFPSFSSGFASLPISGSTTTIPKSFRRGYIESWNLFVQDDLGRGFVANVGYVGTHQVRQMAIVSPYNAAPLPSAATVCMANKQFNPSSPYYTHALGSNPCSFNANETVNIGAPCPATASGTALGTCYNTGGIGLAEPIFSSNYNGMQAQLTRNGGKNSSFGLVYTFSHAFAFEENGAGSGAAGTPFNFPAYFKFNRATSNYDRTHNFQIFGSYHLPFGNGQMLATHGVANAILGGFRLNGQLSHTSGAPFSVTAASNNINTPGVGSLYADRIAPYKQIGGHYRTPGTGNNGVSGGKAWFDPTAFANPVEPTYTATQDPSTIVSPHFGNTHRNQFRGPGVTNLNASIFRGFHLYRESEFQIRFEAFNILNHAELTSNPTAAVGSGTFGYIQSFGGTRSLQFSGRFNF
jgi:hypothetical protein